MAYLHFSEEELAERRSRACEKMERQGLDAVLLFKQESMFYLTGYDTGGYSLFQCLILRADGDLVLVTRSADKLLAWDLEPGDVIAFHGMTMHGAPGNLQKDNRRRATNTAWVGDDTVYIERPGVMEPDFPDCGPDPGDPLDCARFPRVFDAEA